MLLQTFAADIIVDRPGGQAASDLTPFGEVLLELLLGIEGGFDIRVFGLYFVQIFLGHFGEGGDGFRVHLDEFDLLLEQLDRLDIQLLLPGGGPQLGLLGGDVDDPLQVGRQFVVGVLVEENGALYGRLM